MMPGLHPYFFSEDIVRFLMTTESQDLGFNVSSEGECFYAYGIQMCYYCNQLKDVGLYLAFICSIGTLIESYT